MKLTEMVLPPVLASVMKSVPVAPPMKVSTLLTRIVLPVLRRIRVSAPTLPIMVSR